MRLPTVTIKQEQEENARALHEAIWAAYQAGTSYLLPGEPEACKSRKAAVLQGNLHHFWRARGYRMSVSLRRDRRIQIALSPAPVKLRRRSGPVDYITCQPASWVA